MVEIYVDQHLGGDSQFFIVDVNHNKNMTPSTFSTVTVEHYSEIQAFALTKIHLHRPSLDLPQSTLFFQTRAVQKVASDIHLQIPCIQ